MNARVANPELCEWPGCDAPGFVRVNESWYCGEHLDGGMRRVAQQIAEAKGIDFPERAADRLVGMMRAQLAEEGEAFAPVAPSPRRRHRFHRRRRNGYAR